MRTTEEADATVVPVQKNNHYRQEPVPTQKIQQQQQQQQQRLFHSSCEISYRSIGDHFLAVAATTLVTDRIKNQLLEHAVQDDSPLWQQPPSRKPPSITSPHPHTNSKNTARKDDMEIHDTDEEDDIDIDIPTVAHLWDPLNDLDVSAQSTRYWPHLPIANPMNVPSRNIDPFVLCQEELSNISHDIRKDLLGTDHPVLHLAANYFFNNNTTTTDSSGGGSGKKFRPLLVHLMAKALQQAAATAAGQPPRDNHPTTDTIDKQVQQLQHQQQNRRYARLAEISELIHTASLFHDDVIDNADTRRGRPTVHAVFGDKMAILAGDYLLARASIGLARLRNVKVVETMSTIIEHLVRGEVMQMKGNSSTNSDKNSVQDRMDYYLRKNFYKTGSLMANSCRSTAILGNYPEEWVDLAYRYGKHTGMAFQLVDDILDFEGSASHMGKPALADLHSGVATAPVLFAAEEYPDQLIPLLDRKFANPGDVELALELVMASSGMDRTRQLARVHAEMAMDAILELTPHETNPDTTLYRDSLVQLAYKVVARTK